MTIIIGLEDKVTKSVFMGGDSAVTTWPNCVEVVREKKIFQIGNMLIGGSGTLRTNQVVRHGISTFRFQFPDEPVMDYLVNAVAEPIRDSLKERGVSKVEANEEISQNWWLIAYQGKIYELACDFAISSFIRGFAAVGSGKEYALAAMEAFKLLPPKERILESLKIVGKFDGFVKPPYYVMELKS